MSNASSTKTRAAPRALAKTGKPAGNGRKRVARPVRAARGQRRGDLLEAALHCFSAHGVEGATVEMILARCGASIGSLYHHFGGKDGLATALYLEGIDAYFRAARALFDEARTTEDKVKALVRAFVDRVAADPAMSSYLFQARHYLRKTAHSAELDRKNAQFLPGIGAWIRKRMSEGELRPLPPECVLPILSGPARDYARRWVAGRVSRPISQVREVLAQAAWDSLRPLGTPPRRGRASAAKTPRQ